MAGPREQHCGAMCFETPDAADGPQTSLILWQDGVHGEVKRELRRRSAIEAAIGHVKTGGHLGRNFLKGRHGDQANAVLTAVG